MIYLKFFDNTQYFKLLLNKKKTSSNILALKSNFFPTTLYKALLLWRSIQSTNGHDNPTLLILFSSFITLTLSQVYEFLDFYSYKSRQDIHVGPQGTFIRSGQVQLTVYVIFHSTCKREIMIYHAVHEFNHQHLNILLHFTKC